MEDDSVDASGYPLEGNNGHPYEDSDGRPYEDSDGHPHEDSLSLDNSLVPLEQFPVEQYPEVCNSPCQLVKLFMARRKCQRTSSFFRTQ